MIAWPSSTTVSKSSVTARSKSRRWLMALHLEGIVNVLIDAGATRSTLSKAAAALGPDADGPPDVLEPATVGPDDSAREAITAFCANYIRAFITQDVRPCAGSPRPAHQMRVAARRLRSGLKAFGPR